MSAGDAVQEKKRKAQVTRERLLDLAIHEFSRHGFDETTMRDLAEAAGMSPGSFYYHFRSKDEIVQAFYERSLQEFLNRVPDIRDRSRRFEDRLIDGLKARIETFENHRPLLIALSRVAVDPRSGLSPFAPGTAAIRRDTIGAIEKLIEGSDLKADEKLMVYVPTLLWMYLMGVVFYWVFDESKDQKKTGALIEGLTPLLVRMMRVSALPLTGPVNRPVLKLLESLWPGR